MVPVVQQIAGESQSAAQHCGLRVLAFFVARGRPRGLRATAGGNTNHRTPSSNTHTKFFNGIDVPSATSPIFAAQLRWLRAPPMVHSCNSPFCTPRTFSSDPMEKSAVRNPFLEDNNLLRQRSGRRKHCEPSAAPKANLSALKGLNFSWSQCGTTPVEIPAPALGAGKNPRRFILLSDIMAG